jgi:hypothetical protein
MQSNGSYQPIQSRSKLKKVGQQELLQLIQQK